MGKRSKKIDPKRVVADGYDVIGDVYARQAVDWRTREREWYVSALVERLQAGSRVLDLGCGAGIPTTRRLSEHFDVTGVDISVRQIERARQNVPDAEFICADMTEVTFPPDSFDGVAAFFSIIHVPRIEHRALLDAVARWLRPGGVFVAAMSASDGAAAYEEDWMGAPMYWSGFDGDTNSRLVRDAGLRIVMAEEKTEQFDDETETWLWVLAERPDYLGPHGP